jgi:hypothetical protein
MTRVLKTTFFGGGPVTAVVMRSIPTPNELSLRTDTDDLKRGLHARVSGDA